MPLRPASSCGRVESVPHEIHRRQFRKITARARGQVVAALDGELGINMARKILPDLILLDIVLPKINGFEVLKDLKGNDATKLIPVIVLTNLSQMGDIGKVMELGVTTYLVKSDQSLKDIAAIVDKTLGGDLPQ